MSTIVDIRRLKVNTTIYMIFSMLYTLIFMICTGSYLEEFLLLIVCFYHAVSEYKDITCSIFMHIWNNLENDYYRCYICLLIHIFRAMYFTFYIHNVVYKNIIFVQQLSLHIREEFLEIFMCFKIFFS